MITFDDGYLSCHARALPALVRQGIRAVFFIATGPVSTRSLFWWDRISWLVKNARHDAFCLRYPFEIQVDRRAGPAAVGRRLSKIAKEHYDLDLDRFLDELTIATGAAWSADLERELAAKMIMTWDHVRGLRQAGMDVGSHTRTHRVLQTLTPAHLADELRGSREDLRRELGEEVVALAYPDGRGVARGSPIRRAILDAGYEIGFTYNVGIQRLRRVDPLGIGRVSVEPSVSAPAFRGSLAIPALRA
jgi:peptidoglycan/xylan/chitin deacetylase (PgdA/CDA1 family)